MTFKEHLISFLKFFFYTEIQLYKFFRDLPMDFQTSYDKIRTDILRLPKSILHKLIVAEVALVCTLGAIFLSGFLGKASLPIIFVGITVFCVSFILMGRDKSCEKTK